MIRLPATVALVCATLGLGACGGGTTIGSAPQPGPTPTPTPTPGLRPTATPAPSGTVTSTPPAAPPPVGSRSPGSVYLGDIGRGAVLIYSSNANGNVAPSAAIAGTNTGFTDSSGSSPIYGIAVDETGSVYVLTQTFDATGTAVDAESILVFPAGSTGNVAPARTIALPTTIDAESLAYAASTLYVTDDANSGAIDVYAASAAGAAPPLRTFTSSPAFANLPLKVSIDSAGRPFVATYDETATPATEATQGVYVFPTSATGAVAPVASLSGGATGFGNGVLDAAVVDGAARIDTVLTDAANDTTAGVGEFAAGASGNAAPAVAFTDASAGGPVDAAVDPNGTLYISEAGNGTASAQVRVFTPGATTPGQTLLAYESMLPLIAYGPYVAADASGTMPLPAAPASHAERHRRTLRTVLRRAT